MGNKLFKSARDKDNPGEKKEKDLQSNASISDSPISTPHEISLQDAYPQEEKTNISELKKSTPEFFNSKWPVVHCHDIEDSELESVKETINKLDADDQRQADTDTYDVTVDQNCVIRQFAVKRLKDDMVELFHDAPPGITAIPMEDDIFLWRISILGPGNSPFQGRVIQGIIQFTGEYPYIPPAVVFTPTIFHPNISESGDLCLNQFHKHWTPCYALSSFLTSVKYLLAEPSGLDPANSLAATVFLYNPIVYDEMARESASLHPPHHQEQLEDQEEALVGEFKITSI